MGSKPFQFKQFAIAHDRCTHKVGTDAVLLGAWVRISPDDTNMLDIGTGSGLIAIMLAQRSSADAHIDALEIEAPDVVQAKENVLQSPWKEKVDVHHTALQAFFPEKKYDVIITNPPYFLDSLLPPDRRRSQARHAQQLTYSDLLHHSRRLLNARGRLAVILPHLQGLKFADLAKDHQLICLRKTTFRSRAGKPPERLLLELASLGSRERESELILHDAGEKWSEEYIGLTREFYLKI